MLFLFLDGYLLCKVESGYWICRLYLNECLGSDLDGDLYFVSWDEDLILFNIDEFMDYIFLGVMILDYYVIIEVYFLF